MVYRRESNRNISIYIMIELLGVRQNRVAKMANTTKQNINFIYSRCRSKLLKIANQPTTQKG